jgi:hypothetical protein
MKNKTVIIFEGVKGSGKTLLTTELKKHLNNSVVFSEDITLKPIKHSEDRDLIVAFYKKIIDEIENSNFTYFLLDRFHFTKWPRVDYQNDYFKEIEELLLSKFDVILILLTINEDSLLQRLKHTQNHRKETGWKLNYDGLSLEDEAKKDVEGQRFFLQHKYTDTLIQRKLVIDSTNLQLNLIDLGIYIQQIKKAELLTGAYPVPLES